MRLLVARRQIRPHWRSGRSHLYLVPVRVGAHREMSRPQLVGDLGCLRSVAMRWEELPVRERRGRPQTVLMGFQRGDAPQA